MWGSGTLPRNMRGHAKSQSPLTLRVLGPLQNLLLPFTAVVTFLTKIQNWCYKTNKNLVKTLLSKKFGWEKALLSKKFGWEKPLPSKNFD